jgi:predicted acyltransferase
MYDINDPEGLFTTLTAFINGYAGYWYCLTMFDNKNDTKKLVKIWIVAGVLCCLTALPLTWLMPLNKKIWSISYTFLTIGISGISLALITVLLDVFKKQSQRYQKVIGVVSAPFVWFGRNPLAIFISRDLVDDIMNSYIIIDGKDSWYYI